MKYCPVIFDKTGVNVTWVNSTFNSLKLNVNEAVLVWFNLQEPFYT